MLATAVPGESVLVKGPPKKITLQVGCELKIYVVNVEDSSMNLGE